MPFIRTIISLAYVGFFMLVSLILLPIEYFIRKKDRERALRFSSKIINWGFRCVSALSGSKTTVNGTENIPSGRGVVFIGNHRSYYDIIIGYPHMPFHTSIISKAGLKKAPAIGAWIKRLECLFLERDNMRQGLSVILEGIEQIKRGSNMLVFPEVTRNKGEGIGEFHSGSFKLATKSGAPIVPVVQTRTREVFEEHFPWLHPQHTTISFLKPIETKGLTKDEIKKLPETVHNIMLEYYNKQIM